jgi:hypothetical protein
MNLRLLALCSIEGVNWNVVAREALRSGGLARLLAAPPFLFCRGELCRDARSVAVVGTRPASGSHFRPVSAHFG